MAFAGHALLTAVLIGAATNADAQVVTIAWDSTQKFDRMVTVAPGKFEELCGSLQPGQRVGWSFESAEPVDFNIHYHLGSEVKYPARGNATRTASGTLLVDSPQDYCWMLSNKLNAAVSVRVQLVLK